MAKSKSKIGPITVTRTNRLTRALNKPYKDMADAVMGPTRGNLGRVIMPKLKPKISPAPSRATKPGNNPSQKYPKGGWIGKGWK